MKLRRRHLLVLRYGPALIGGGGGGKKRGADAAAPAAKAAKKTKASEEGSASTAPAAGRGRCPERDGKGFCKIPRGTLSKVNPKPQALNPKP